MKYFYVSIESMFAYTDDPHEANPVYSKKGAELQARRDLIERLQRYEVDFSVEVEEVE